MRTQFAQTDKTIPREQRPLADLTNYNYCPNS
jgi:hypothetical protein